MIACVPSSEPITRAQTVAWLRRVIDDTGRSPPSNELPRQLYHALMHYFGSLEAARTAADVAPPPQWHKWTVDRIRDELRALHRQGVPTTHEALAERERQDLIGAITRHVGSLRRARRLARVPDPPRRRSGFGGEPWDDARIVEEILALHADGKPLAASKVSKTLVAAARVHMGSWQAAIEAAGFDYAEVRLRRPPYGEAELFALLCELAREQPNMSLGELHGHKLAPTLLRRFPTLEVAAERAGLSGWPLRENLSLMSREETIAALRGRARQRLAVHAYVLRRDDVRLWDSARRHFVTLDRALQAAGVASTSPARREWTPREIVRELRWRMAKGLPTHASAIQEECGGLYQAAFRLFGSYNTVAGRLGIEPPRRSWSKEDVIAELRRLAKEHRPVLYGLAVPTALRDACAHYFGSFRAARDAAGLCGLSRTWTKEQIIEALRARAAAGQPMSANSMPSALSTACWRYFGSHQAALAAACVG